MHTIIKGLVSALRLEQAQNAQLHLLETIHGKHHIVEPTIYKDVVRAGKAGRKKKMG